MLAPELETLDQLNGGDLPLALFRGIFSDDQRFARAIVAMLNNGEMLLRTSAGGPVPRWQWNELLENLTDDEAAEYWLSLTEAGGRRIG